MSADIKGSRQQCRVVMPTLGLPTRYRLCRPLGLSKSDRQFFIRKEECCSTKYNWEQGYFILSGPIQVVEYITDIDAKFVKHSEILFQTGEFGQGENRHMSSILPIDTTSN